MNNSGSSLSGGGLVSGSQNNVRWEVTAANTNTGVFSLAIRRGDDENAQKSVLETFNNVSLDPLATNYIETVIGNSYYGDIQNDSGDFYIQENGSYVNRSKYVYVSKVNYPTPGYFDNAGNAKIEFTGSIPVIGSGSFKSGTGELFHGEALFNENISAVNTQGINAIDYTASINLLSNSDDYQFNVLTAPGIIQEFNSSETNLLVTTAEARRDCLSIIDLRGYGSTIGNVVGASSGFDSSYAATYWPWLQLVDPDTGRVIWSPASVLIPGVYAFTDASSDPWFAPAGLTRGGLGQVVRAERKLTSGNRDSLYEARRRW
jgi:phage tail sheath protein FI